MKNSTFWEVCGVEAPPVGLMLILLGFLKIKYISKTVFFPPSVAVVSHFICLLGLFLLFYVIRLCLLRVYIFVSFYLHSKDSSMAFSYSWNMRI